MEIGSRAAGGLVKITVTTGGSGYTEPPSVLLSGGGGTGATAYSHMAGTRVQSVVIASPGSGYTGSPSVSFAPSSASVVVASLTAGTSSATVTIATAAATTYARVDLGSGSVPIGSFQSGTQFVVGATTGISSGAATLYGPGSGAAATAYAYTGPLQPASFFKGRYGTMYGVDGMGRGFRWDGGTSVAPIGLAKPAAGPNILASTTSSGQYVKSIQILGAGVGYSSEPAVVITGGTPTRQAQARAAVANGRVVSITLTDPGAGYQSVPQVSFSGGMGSGVSLQVGVLGSVSALTLSSAGSGYTTSPAVTAGTSNYQFTVANHGLSAGSTFTFSQLTGGSGLTTGVPYYVVSAGANTFSAGTTAGTTAATNIFTSDLTGGRIVIPGPRVQFDSSRGLTGALASISVNNDGTLSAPTLLAAGTGATTTGITATVIGGGGTGGSLAVGMQYAVNAVTAASTGSGYHVAPVITFRAAPADTFGSGAAATAIINSSGNVTGATVTAGGQYSLPPTALILDTQAQAAAGLGSPAAGVYRCAVRYLDNTPESAGGPLASSISHLTEVDAGTGASSLTWNITHHGLEDRVHAMELWRTTADQSVLLFRVATINRSSPAFTAPYVDTLTDAELRDVDREGYALMPVTLPSGQINARRFEIPPGEFSVACMFQDRAWYAVDSSGEKPNSLYYSEVDEPESVPLANELVVQENTGDPDKVVALIPLGGYLLIAQQSHLYKLSYVAQPVIDASILLVGYRGVLNSRCWDVMGGVAFLADSSGMYAFDGSAEEAISVAVDNYWRDNVIDFSQASKFHVRADLASRTVRFYYCQVGDTQPVRALCYCVATKAWWEETYPTAVTATAPATIGSKRTVVHGLASGELVKSSGVSDASGAVPYSLRTGNFALAGSGSREVAILYEPTLADATLNLRLHYNNSASPRPNAITSDRGSGFTSTQGATAAQLNMKLARSALGDATGIAKAHFAGRVEDRSAGADRHVAIALDGQQSGSTQDDAVAFYGLNVEGAG